MILLCVSDSLQVANTTTDWMQGWGAMVQSIGAVFAIGVIIWGFSQLNKDSKDKQKQIDSLTDLAKEAKEQTKHFSLQVDEMIKGNVLLRENVNLIQKTVLINEESIKIQREQNDQNKLKRKLDIQPQFEFNKSFTITRVTSRGTVYYINSFRLSIENIGKKATIIEVFKFENNDLETDFSYYINKEYIKGTINTIDFKRESPESYSEKLIHLKILYEDIEGNIYYQTIEGKFGESIIVSKPIEII